MIIRSSSALECRHALEANNVIVQQSLWLISVDSLNSLKAKPMVFFKCGFHWLKRSIRALWKSSTVTFPGFPVETFNQTRGLLQPSKTPKWQRNKWTYALKDNCQNFLFIYSQLISPLWAIMHDGVVWLWLFAILTVFLSSINFEWVMDHSASEQWWRRGFCQRVNVMCYISVKTYCCKWSFTINFHSGKRICYICQKNLKQQLK